MSVALSAQVITQYEIIQTLLSLNPQGFPLWETECDGGGRILICSMVLQPQQPGPVQKTVKQWKPVSLTFIQPLTAWRRGKYLNKLN